MFWIKLVPRVGGGYMRIYTKSPPPDVKVRKRTPEETFFTRGGPENIPSDVKIAMGLMDVKITPTGFPKIRFKRS